METVADTPSSLVVDAHGAMGAPVSFRTMRAAIEKAGTNGAAFGCVRDSNHFGIAGYYAMMALDRGYDRHRDDQYGHAGRPTFGREPMFGTQPDRLRSPCGCGARVCARTWRRRSSRAGRSRSTKRLGKELPDGWAVDARGQSAHDPGATLAEMTAAGGILPLGGLGEEFGGHKGYGLAVMVDVLCGVLCGGSFGRR